MAKTIAQLGDVEGDMLQKGEEIARNVGGVAFSGLFNIFRFAFETEECTI